ncbi:hypothetical protein LY15_000749 [Prauserella flava]|nr:hypothetical protein [Prauserella flava]MCR3733358.1 hypothetical protein [Prauserella salsuginis]
MPAADVTRAKHVVVRCGLIAPRFRQLYALTDGSVAAYVGDTGEATQPSPTHRDSTRIHEDQLPHDSPATAPCSVRPG